MTTAQEWNNLYPIGTPVVAYPGTRDDEPLTTRTRTAAWTLGHGAAVVSVEGYTGGIALTHVHPAETQRPPIAESSAAVRSMPPEETPRSAIEPQERA